MCVLANLIEYHTRIPSRTTGQEEWKKGIKVSLFSDTAIFFLEIFKESTKKKET